MSIISLDGDNTIPQPSTLKEELLRKVFDKSSITGVIRRTWMADKRQATMGFMAITIPQYNQLATYCFNQANPVTYYNSVTGFGFTGFTTISEDVFIPGDSWLKNVTITILEL